MSKKKKSWSVTRKLVTSGLIIIGLLIIALGLAGGYFFRVAEVRADKDFINSSALTKKDTLYDQQEVWHDLQQTTWQVKADDGIKLVGHYAPASKPTQKTVVVIHGFGADHNAMAPYGALFHQLGYNVLMPDDRAAGQSEGDYIGFGYLDAKDYLHWLQAIIEKNGTDSQIVVMGASMGGATTMMLSGMNPPKQVKAFIEDAGYTSLMDELKFQAGSMYGIPQWLANILVPVVSLYSEVLAGYNYYQANAVQLLQHNQRPMLFIHGGNDKFVPTKYVHEVYAATNGPKVKYVVPGASHVQSYATNPVKYQEKVQAFLAKYFK